MSLVEVVSYAAFAVLLASSLALLISQNWRWSIIALAVQYLAVFWLVLLSWPTGLAVVKLVTGWMAGALIGASQPAEELQDSAFDNTQGMVFRLAASLIGLILVFAAAPLVADWIPAAQPILLGGLVLIANGLLQLGMTTRPLRVILGILTVLSGFEILYAAVEQSVLVAGLSSVITLGLALVGAYLMAAPEMDAEE
jgi:hypothetical protein